MDSRLDPGAKKGKKKKDIMEELVKSEPTGVQVAAVWLGRLLCCDKGPAEGCGGALRMDFSKGFHTSKIIPE